MSNSPPKGRTAMADDTKDLITRNEAARILTLTVSGVRKLEGSKLTPVRLGRVVCFDRGEVEAVRAKRGARIPAATKPEREAVRAADDAARENAAQLRADEKELKRLGNLLRAGRH